MLALLAILTSASWVALLVAAPLLPGWGGALLYGMGAVICHQIPERSFHLFGSQIPVCGRCLGLYVGVALGTAAWATIPGAGQVWPARAARGVVLAAAMPTLATLVLELSGLWSPSNAVRAVAAIPLGAAIAVVVMAVWRGTAFTRGSRTAA